MRNAHHNNLSKLTYFFVGSITKAPNQIPIKSLTTMANTNNMINTSCMQSTIAYPWTNTQKLAEFLNNGELSLSTAIGKVNEVTRETLKVIEDFAFDQTKLYLDRKGKIETMDKLVSELSEKCQAMQQALLYKDERYDEKCREVARYKIICELSAKQATEDDFIQIKSDPNNQASTSHQNDYDNNVREDPRDNNQPGLIYDDTQCVKPKRKNLMSHTKLSQHEMHLSDYVEPLQQFVDPVDDDTEYISKRVRTDTPRPDQSYTKFHSDDNQRFNFIAPCYVGGPSKRKNPATMGEENIYAHSPKHGLSSGKGDEKFKERLSNIGGINVEPRINTGPVPVDKIFGANVIPTTFRCYNLQQQEQKKVKISMVGQSNEIMSSSRDAVRQLKQRFNQQNLHQQVAGGPNIRLAGRRKKEWPF